MAYAGQWENQVRIDPSHHWVCTSPAMLSHSGLSIDQYGSTIILCKKARVYVLSMWVHSRSQKYGKSNTKPCLCRRPNDLELPGIESTDVAGTLSRPTNPPRKQATNRSSWLCLSSVLVYIQTLRCFLILINQALLTNFDQRSKPACSTIIG